MSTHHLSVVQGNAEMMMDVGIFAGVIADLINENTTAREGDREEFLNDYRIYGLLRGLKLAGTALCERSEALEEFVEKEEKAQAALQRRKGQDSSQESSVEGECGRAPTV